MNESPVPILKCRRCGERATVEIQNEYYCDRCEKVQTPWLKRTILAACLLLTGCIQPYVPPGPNPPKPDDPVVVPDKITGDFRVLIIEETDEHRKWPQSQLNIRTSAKLDDWFLANKVQHRMWDDDIEQIGENSDFVRMLDSWKKDHDTSADNRAIVIEHGAKSFSGDLPKTVDDTIKLLEQYQ